MENTFRPWVKWYTSKKRNYRYKNINILVNPDVFHPGLFFSTKILLEFISKKDLKEKKVLELGAGTGLISIYAAAQGAKVIASDINLKSVENIQENIEKNQELIDLNNGSVTVIHSDLFQSFPKNKFDLILINPPFYRGEAKNLSQLAWYCGKDLNFFSSFFEDLKQYLNPDTNIYMILSQDAEINEIKKLADKHEYELEIAFQKKNFLETNYVFKVAGFKKTSELTEANV